MNRRRLIAAMSSGSVGVISGCAGLGLGDSSSDSSPEDSSNPEPDQLDSEDEEKSETEADFSPEPDYLIAQDGSGDYESVTEVIQVAQDGDILGLKPGIYEWNPTINENSNTFNDFNSEFTFVGKEVSSTTLNISPEGSSVFSVGDNNPQFHKLQIQIDDAVEWEARQTYAGGGDGSVRPVKFDECQVSGNISGSYHANNTTFKTDAAPTEGVIKDCTFEGQVRIGEATIERSELTEGGIEAAGCRLTECTLMGNADDVALEMSGDGSIRFCEINGQIQNSNGTWRSNRFIEDSGSFDYFIDDSGPNKMWGNVFDGADIRVSGSVTMFEEEEGLGNYYSEWDGASDDDDDGISELPRPIPGDSDVTDQYPLVNDDIGSYGMEPEDVPFYRPE